MKTKTPKKEKELAKQFEELRWELRKIEKTKQQAKNQKLVGRCYRYRNSYGSGESWWLYTRVTSAGDHWPHCISFQKCTMGRFEVRLNDVFTGHDRHERITRKEYDAAWADFTAGLLATHGK